MKIIVVLLPIYAAAFALTASRGRITTHMKGAPHDVEANVGAGWAGMIKYEAILFGVISACQLSNIPYSLLSLRSTTW